MSLIKFELKDEHIKLVKQLKWTAIKFPHLKHEVNENSPFTHGESITEDIGIILHGFSGEGLEHDSEQITRYTQEQIDEMKKLYEELPTALEIICSLNTFEPGWFKTKSYVSDWKRFEKVE